MTEDSTKTTGRISSTFDQQVEGIGVNVLYRDPAGQVVAADNGWIEFAPAGSDANFMVEGWSEQKPKVLATEVYYDAFLPATQ